MSHATPAYIGLGSNLEDPLRQVETALVELGDLPRTRVAARSGWYRSIALGPGPQPNYINGVALLHTHLEPRELLGALQTIEAAHGRVRKERWGARTLDMDILVFGDRTVATEVLSIPHPELARRNFVLYPLAELAPDLILADGRAIGDLLANVPSQGIVRLADS